MVEFTRSGLFARCAVCNEILPKWVAIIHRDRCIGCAVQNFSTRREYLDWLDSFSTWREYRDYLKEVGDAGRAGMEIELVAYI